MLQLHPEALRSLFASIARAHGGPTGAEAWIREVLRDFYARMSRDVLLEHFFIGRDTASIADKQAEFLLRAMGARATYSGKPPARAHDELPEILSGHFDRRIVILEQTLRDRGLADEDIRAWVNFERAFRQAIVRK